MFIIGTTNEYLSPVRVTSVAVRRSPSGGSERTGLLGSVMDSVKSGEEN
jgi:hypothetical protein